MVKVDKHSSKQGWFSKGVNIAITALAFAVPLKHFFTGNFRYFTETDPAGVNLIGDMTGQMGKNLPRAIAFWSVPGSAVGLGLAIRYIRKKFPVR